MTVYGQDLQQPHGRAVHVQGRRRPSADGHPCTPWFACRLQPDAARTRKEAAAWHRIRSTKLHADTRQRPHNYPKLFSALYEMYKKPSSALYCSWTSDMRVLVLGEVLFFMKR
mmetsp:Transcript_84864/g.252957  ORF Transcript_84864/g.252957 Transcript_84864/m.252957 type:complete len:113 (+) Transcript_84864:26-364(+)